MNYTKIQYKEEAQKSLDTGVTTLYNVVSTTLGARGRNVAVAYADPKGNVFAREVLHDGVRIAKAINVRDEFINMGVQLLKQAAQKQVAEQGDGTTVSIVLAHAIYKEAQKLIATGISPMLLREQIDVAVTKITKEIDNYKKEVKTLEEEIQVATISSEDKELGKLVAETVHKMGKDGLVAVEEFKGDKTEVEIQKGMQLDKGFVHPYFMTDPDRLEATLDDVDVLVTDKEIVNLPELANIIKAAASQGKKLLIITPHISEDAMAALLQNKMKGAFLSCVVKAPSFGKHQNGFLQDIAIFTGARFISRETNDRFENMKLEDLGHAEYITATETTTLIVGGKGDKETLNDQIESIKTMIPLQTSDFDKEKLKERLARLTSGVALIKVGGSTEVEMLEKVERVKDAVAAAKSAMKDGIVPGGEIIYLQLRNKLDKTNYGENILFHSLEQPFVKLMDNAGFNSGQMLERLKDTVITDIEGFGVDVTDGEVKNFYEAGIIDPAGVSVSAIKNAASVAIALFTTDVLIVPDEETK